MNEAFYAQVALWSTVGGALAFIGCIMYGWIRFIAPAVIAAQERKNAELVEAEARRDALKAEVEVAKGELAVADADVVAIATRARRDAERLRQTIVDDARSEGKRLVRNAEGELDRSRLTAREALHHELLTLALQHAREAAAVLEEPTQRRLIERTVASLERRATTGARA